jgi:hypothetical protein
MAGASVSAGWLLLGLLAIAFVGSSVVRGRGVRGFGLPSGSEWLLTGIVFGPQFLRLVGPEQLTEFAPIIAAASGWVALTIGQRFGVLARPLTRKDTFANPRNLVLGVGISVLTAAAVAAVAYRLLGSAHVLGERSRLATSLYLGLLLSGSTRQLIEWARERLRARGRLTDALESLMSGTELVALLGTAPLFVLLSAPETSLGALALRACIPIVLGISLGTLGLYLLRVEVRLAETWGILLGMLLFATGLSLRSGVSVVATGFVLGWVLGRDPRSGRELRMLTHPTEGAVVLPMLVVAGAAINWTALGALAFVLVALVVLTLSMNLLSAILVRPFLGGRKLPLAALGSTLSASGEITCLLGLGFWLAAPGVIGQLALASAVSVSLIGEAFGARGLRMLLTVAEEIPTATSSPISTSDDRISGGP